MHLSLLSRNPLSAATAFSSSVSAPSAPAHAPRARAATPRLATPFRLLQRRRSSLPLAKRSKTSSISKFDEHVLARFPGKDAIERRLISSDLSSGLRQKNAPHRSSFTKRACYPSTPRAARLL